MEPKFFELLTIGDVPLLAAKGHFATRNSHINYFIDVTAQKYSLKGANAVARDLSNKMRSNLMIDSILCMDGTSAIGTCLARLLTQPGAHSLSERENMYIVKGELDNKGKLIFRDNARFMLEEKNVLILMASLTTGTTAMQGKRSVEYYGGRVVGIAAIYSALTEIAGLPVISNFDFNVLPDYASHTPTECPMCKQGKAIDAVVNTFGFSKI